MPRLLHLLTPNVIVFLEVVTYLRGTPLAGPYTIVPELAEPCPKDLMGLPWDLDVKFVRDRSNPNIFFVTLNWAGQFVFDDHKEAHAVMASWDTRGGWKENALVMKFKKLCATFKTYMPDSWREMMRLLTSNVTITVRDCPFPPAAYSIRNISSSWMQPKGLPVMYYGKWRIDTRVVDPVDKKILGCLRIYASIVPLINRPGKR
ncbi:uncharacterized protein LOC113215612 isoform X1 [Frankliniella occidentalis]|uniref:Uncharacterized protein LOC113215612 isoform X1 n=1 Tax=Frankliniella occidentalis TaxID=133901 RepID=A0A9C6X7H1_FRAOC|nr:uncharacterized protein LOC113215612 isoform X1 [Frankliniella occidentalis]